ncbi:hypothetical protein FALBO_17180 [Fusarium albosuccineum]|uniref:Uncharacterized protein n=1 Tax=Fusarium albosuccineum TaxID=1237068 RepID=A0A8H4K673_9HYPO|nr:hypothetical protein FALBO_17180 [Fusarium albosuccineum]
MSSFDFTKRLRDEKQEKFLGTASIRFETLDFSLSQEQYPLGEDPDRSNVESLEHMFQQGCSWSPDQISHQIPALIDPAQLEEAAHNAAVSIDVLKQEAGNFVELNFPPNFRIQCLRGQARVLAANAVLANRHKRWVIRLYSPDLSEEAKIDLIHERSSERPLEDDDLFYRITLHWVHYEAGLESSLTNRWLALLARQSQLKAKEVSRLWNTSNPYKALFKKFHQIPALFYGCRLGQVGRMLSMPPQQTQNQIAQVFNFFWETVCNRDSSYGMRLDVVTIKTLSGRAPGVDHQGESNLIELEKKGKILKNFNENERKEIRDRLVEATRDRLVPTLDIFFGNLLYLREVTGCLMNLVDTPAAPRHLREKLSEKFVEEGDCCLLQVSDTGCKSLLAVNVDRFELAYRQLWLFALREYPSIPAERKKKRAGAESHTNKAVLYKFAVLAYRLGFRSGKIMTILREQRPGYIPATLSALDVKGPDTVEGPNTCGKPNPRDLAEYKGMIFLANFHRPCVEATKDFSFFLVQRSLYFDMFPDNLVGIDALLDEAAEAEEHELIDGDFRNGISDMPIHDHPGCIGKQNELLSNIARLEERIIMAEEQVNQLEEENAQLRQSLNKERRNDILDADIAAKDSTAKMLGAQLAAARSQIQHLEQTREQNSKTIDDLEATRSEIESQIQAKQSKLDTLEGLMKKGESIEAGFIKRRAQIIEELETLNADAEREKKDLQKANDELQLENGKLERNKGELTVEVADLDRKKSELELGNGKLQEDMDKLTDKVADLEKKNKELGLANDNLTKQKAELESDVSRLTQQVQELRAAKNSSSQPDDLQMDPALSLLHEGFSSYRSTELNPPVRNGDLTFLIEKRDRIKAVVTAKSLRDYTHKFMTQGFSMFDRYNRELTPSSCFDTLKGEKEESNRLIVLRKTRDLPVIETNPAPSWPYQGSSSLRPTELDPSVRDGDLMFFIEKRDRIQVLETKQGLQDFTDKFLAQGYSMFDSYNRHLAPVSCFDALQPKKQESDRLIILQNLRDIYTIGVKRAAPIGVKEGPPKKKVLPGAEKA